MQALDWAAEFGFGSSPDGSLEDWIEIAHQWHARNVRIVNQCAGADAPFVHAEHGNMHNFLLAAEACGISTMREVLGNRGHADGPQGRLDAAMIRGDRLDLVEAKFKEFKLSAEGLPSARDQRDCIRLLDEAEEQAGAYWNRHPVFVKGHRRERRIAVLFVAAHLADFSVQADTRIARYIEIMAAIPNTFIAWSFPAEARRLSYWGRHYPGVVLIARLSSPEPAPTTARDD